MYISRILHDPLIPGECLLKPAKTLLQHKPDQLWKISTLFWIVETCLASVVAAIGCLTKTLCLTAGFQEGPQRKLVVHEWPQNSPQTARIAAITKAWQKVAESKQALVKSKKEETVFFDSAKICYLINECVTHPYECQMLYDSIILCEDETLKRPQAIALVKRHELKTCTGASLGKYLKVVHLVTNPINVRSEVNSTEYARAHGAASAILMHIRHTCLLKNLSGIYLESVSSAQSFYKKHKFVPLDRHAIRMAEANTNPMQLLASKM